MNDKEQLQALGDVDLLHKWASEDVEADSRERMEILTAITKLVSRAQGKAIPNSKILSAVAEGGVPAVEATQAVMAVLKEAADPSGTVGDWLGAAEAMEHLQQWPPSYLRRSGKIRTTEG